jgi:hypothetical protein
MPAKRARITDRDPLTPTDKVLAQYEQVNKSSSQLPESAGNETQSPKQESSTQVDKLASQQPNFSTSEEVNILKSTSQQVNFSTSEEVNSLDSTSQQSNNLTSQQASKVDLTSQQVNNLTSEKVVIEPPIGTQTNSLASQQSNKSASQQAKISKTNQPTSQQSKNIASQIVDMSTSQQVINPNVTSQQSNKLTSEQANMTELDQETSQLADNQVRQQAQNPVLRKATFQVDGAILDALDRYHLQLQIELGKRNAPYKEILVEEAIAIWLERATKSPDRVVKSLLKRQEQR